MQQTLFLLIFNIIIACKNTLIVLMLHLVVYCIIWCFFFESKSGSISLIGTIICNPVWQKGTYSLSTFTTSRSCNFLSERSLVEILHHHDGKLHENCKDIAMFNYYEVIGVQSLMTGKAISPLQLGHTFQLLNETISKTVFDKKIYC